MTEQFKIGDEVFLRGKITQLGGINRQGTGWLSTSIGSVLVSEKDLAPVPQKVIIPQFVADWITEFSQCFNLYKMFRSIDDAPTNVYNWFSQNTSEKSIILARAFIEDYEVEKEPLYQIPLKGLTTTDGEQQYLTEKYGQYFASQKHTELKQTFTQSELDNNVPKHYRQFAEEVANGTKI